MSRIEQIIGEIEDYISSCKAVPLSNTKIYVNKEDMEELIRELRLKTPDEIKKYQKLISNKDEIMQRAYEQANEVIAEASAKAQEIVDRAVEEANAIRMGSIQYTDEMLGNLQMIIEHTIEDTRAKYDVLLGSLSKDLNIVVSNRKELRPEEQEVAAEQELAANVKEVMDDDGPTDEE